MTNPTRDTTPKPEPTPDPAPPSAPSPAPKKRRVNFPASAAYPHRSTAPLRGRVLAVLGVLKVASPNQVWRLAVPHHKRSGKAYEALRDLVENKLVEQRGTTTARPGAWAAATFRDGQDVHRVRQYGGRRLWDDFEHPLAWWHDAGEPGMDRLGLTLTPDGWHTWLDDPAQPI
ncbi:hypothetical protein GCM10010495_80150 [Kitasatospora herbaricolor]|uniref:hypothetical protein n=1 Tax=Kitasatospora herbaricolor TaxID=68217 RepID=UPI00174AE46D|nr:hypothetical protein [Kitasatospora herbaricolor]MDQ0305563.1 hypothetical protein [Kitasatospora herbaricolor]GGV50438.1 hypothetical protein GCM10010495_80150 [Kitasatospora herbaricolor]